LQRDKSIRRLAVAIIFQDKGILLCQAKVSQYGLQNRALHKYRRDKANLFFAIATFYRRLGHNPDKVVQSYGVQPFLHLANVCNPEKAIFIGHGTKTAEVLAANSWHRNVVSEAA